MILLLRGHIRNSFDNKNLYNLVKQIYKNNINLEIYIHTWSILQNNISWRKIDTRSSEITPEFIYNYFDDLRHIIKHIIIDDDTNIKLIGNLTGKIINSKAPVIGWKNYWYGKFQIINHLKSILTTNNQVIINTRFDILSNSNNFTSTFIIERIEACKNINFIKNIFIKDNLCLGIDNLYIGNIDTQYKLINHFYENLDDILINSDKKIINQEFLVYIENNKINYN